MKYWKLGTIMIALSLLLVGCGKKPEQTVQQAIKKVDEADNLTMKLKLELQGTQEGTEMDISLDGVIKADIKANLLDIAMKMNIGGLSVTVQNYTKEEGDQIISYTKNPLGGDWLKETEKVSEEEEVNIQDLLTTLENGTEIKKVESDLEGIDKYEMTLPKDDLQALFTLFNEAVEESSVSVKSDLVSNLYVKDGVLFKMDVDFLPVIDLSNSSATFTKYKMTVEFSDVNNTTVQIPEEVIRNAQESKTDENGELKEEYALNAVKEYAQAVEKAALAYIAENGEQPADFYDYFSYVDSGEYYVSCDDVTFTQTANENQVTLNSCSIDFGDKLYKYENGVASAQ